jgi:predicted NodU family carbamoyl transferase
MSELAPKTEKRSLRCDLTAKEIHDHSLQLAEKNKSIVAIEEEKKSVMSQYKARIDETKATINKLSNIVTDGFEMRDVECEITYHKPQQGKKTIVRKDLDKVHAVETMEEWEFNLFNQPDDQETSDLLEAEREKLSGNSNGKKGRHKPLG